MHEVGEMYQTEVVGCSMLPGVETEAGGYYWCVVRLLILQILSILAPLVVPLV